MIKVANNGSDLPKVNTGLTAQQVLTAFQRALGDMTDEQIQALLNNKQDKLTTTQMAAVNSGIDSGAVAQIGINTAIVSYIQELGIKNRFPQVRRIGTSNANAASTFTQSGVTYTVNDDGTITLTASSATNSDSIVWLYDDFSAILADNIADGTYYFITGFTGTASTARMRIRTGSSNADYLVVSQYATVPESTYAGMNVSIIVYSGFSGTITIKPMFVKKDIYEPTTAWEPYSPTGRELLDMMHKYHTTNASLRNSQEQLITTQQDVDLRDESDISFDGLESIIQDELSDGEER